jgi:drug/metabolite transporter (DMT)-like permease
MNICTGVLLPVYILATRRRGGPESGVRSIGPRLLAAAVSATSYGIAVWAFSQGSIGRAAVLRETSVLFAAILGSVLLKEPFGTRRILSALVILAGFALWP